MGIRTNGNLAFFLATFSRTNGNFSDFLSNETVFHCFVANSSRTNGNLAQNACTKNENGNPFVREDTVLRREVQRPGPNSCKPVLFQLEHIQVF